MQVPDGTTVMLTATADAGARFIAWEGGFGDCSKGSTCSITLAGSDTYLHALFE